MGIKVEASSMNEFFAPRFLILVFIVSGEVILGMKNKVKQDPIVNLSNLMQKRLLIQKNQYMPFLVIQG